MQPPIQRVEAALSLGRKQSEREAEFTMRAALIPRGVVLSGKGIFIFSVQSGSGYRSTDVVYVSRHPDALFCRHFLLTRLQTTTKDNTRHK
jgi:hypothetical protein